jgi:hypothetical protein
MEHRDVRCDPVSVCNESHSLTFAPLKRLTGKGSPHCYTGVLENNPRRIAIGWHLNSCRGLLGHEPTPVNQRAID